MLFNWSLKQHSNTDLLNKTLCYVNNSILLMYIEFECIDNRIRYRQDCHMSTLTKAKKPAQVDWHKADIKAAVEKAGYTLRKLSLANGMNAYYMKEALKRPLPKAEAIIAKLIGCAPADIWPSRYEADGSPKRGLYTGSHHNGCDYLSRSVRSAYPSRNGNVRRVS